jgi:RNA polymerase sigma-70 factor, ECF subfamily
MTREKQSTCMHDDKQNVATLLFRPKMFLSVMRSLKRLGVPPSDRRDVAGDVWLSAAACWHTYDPNVSRPERWLNGIVLHVAAHYRERRYHHREVLTCHPPHVVDSAPDVLSLLGTMTTRTEVTAALRTIDVDLASILVQHDLDGISMIDIAQRMGRPLSTVYKMRVRALVALRVELERRAREN